MSDNLCTRGFLLNSLCICHWSHFIWIYRLFVLFCVVLSEKATSSGLPSEDWSLNLEICDIINETDDGCDSITSSFHGAACLSLSSERLCCFSDPKMQRKPWRRGLWVIRTSGRWCWLWPWVSVTSLPLQDRVCVCVCPLHHKTVVCFRFLRRVWRTAASVSMCTSAPESLWRASWSGRYCPKTTHPWSFTTESWASSRWGEAHCRCC